MSAMDDMEILWGDSDRRAVIVAPDDYPPTAPLFWHIDRLLAFEGWTVGRVSLTAGLSESGEFLSASTSLLVTKSEGSLVGLDFPGVPGIWITPRLDDDRLVGALSGAGSGLLVGVVDDPTWSVQAAARMRGMEILQLTGVDHDLEIPGDPIATLNVLGRVLGRCQATIRRLSRVAIP